MDLYRGRKTYAGVGAIVGAIVGGTSGAIGSYTVLNPLDASTGAGTWYAVFGGVLGGGLGALFGSGIGYLFKADRWEEVPLDRFRVSFAPRSDGRFVLGFRFAP
jgi:hypothetical protein